MKVLILGSGAREHSLAWKIKQSPLVDSIFVAPGNSGTATVAQNVEVTSIDEIMQWLKLNPVDLIIVGPDNYLAEGIVDRVKELGIKIFGPTKAAAEIEWSKSFAKQFMQEEGIPTAAFQTFSNYEKAQAFLKNQKFPLVIKASGLAFGKGVIIVENEEVAEQALKEMMVDKIFAQAGAEVVIEEYLQGREISIHAFCDGDNTILFPASQDHKRIYEGDKGPNTGGMGTITPVPWVTQTMLDEIKEKVVLPTLKGLKQRGRTFKGILFPGIMITEDGPKVIEFNARFGDPETQSYMRLLDSDLIDILLACVDGTLKNKNIKWSDKSACCIVCASEGYPGEYKKDIKISIKNIADLDTVVFHAGTKATKNGIITNGGRVLSITTTDQNLRGALAKACDSILSISFEGMQYRKDIGQKSIN